MEETLKILDTYLSWSINLLYGITQHNIEVILNNMWMVYCVIPIIFWIVYSFASVALLTIIVYLPITIPITGVLSVVKTLFNRKDN
jgi:hypothetical protein